MTLEELIIIRQKSEHDPQLDLFNNSLVNEVKKISASMANCSSSFLKDCSQVYNSYPELKSYFESTLMGAETPPLESFARFILKWSYGLSYRYENGRHTFIPLEQDRKETARSTFIRKVDLLKLITYIYTHYEQKLTQYASFQTANTVSINGKLAWMEGFFYKSFWKNTFNDYKSYEGIDKKTICLFNDGSHVIGSLLHSAHPKIHYLQFRIHENGDENHLPDPLATAILFEAIDIGGDLGKRYMAVEGVLANFGDLNIDRQSFYSIVWKSIQDFARKMDARAIFMNTCHSPNQSEPHEFVNYVFNLEKIAKQGLKGRFRDGIFELLDQTGNNTLQKLSEEAWFSHNLTIPSSSFDADLAKFSMRTSKQFLYGNEQYTDTFHLGKVGLLPIKGSSNAFWEMKGYTQGFEVKDFFKMPGLWSRVLQIVIFGSALSLAASWLLKQMDDQYGGNILQNKVQEDVQRELNSLLVSECKGEMIQAPNDFNCMIQDPCAIKGYSARGDQEYCIRGYKQERFSLQKIKTVNASLWPMFYNPTLNLTYMDTPGGSQIPLQTNDGAREIVDLLNTLLYFQKSKTPVLTK